MKTEIYLRRKNKIILAPSNGSSPRNWVSSVVKNFESIGYTCSQSLVDALANQSTDDLVKFHKKALTILKRLRGEHVKHKPMYNNFPQEVMDMEESELYLNAIFHYIGDMVGLRIMPVSEQQERFPLIDNFNLTVLDLGTEEDFKQLMVSLMASKTSLSETDKEDIKYFVSKYDLVPEKLPFKENLAFIAPVLFDKNQLPIEWFSTARDVLRLAAAFCGGDVSLATKTKYKLSRSKRKYILNVINQSYCSNYVQDAWRDREVWLRLGEVLHPGEFKNKFPKAWGLFSNLRDSKNKILPNTLVEAGLLNHDFQLILTLKNRPGEFARRLDHLCRTFGSTRVLQEFNKVSHNVSFPVLLQAWNHFQNRKSELRVVFPKGNTAKLQVLSPQIDELDTNPISKALEDAMCKILSSRETLGKCYIDPWLMNFIVPFSQRSASKSLRNIIRGSRIGLYPTKDTVRFFCYWHEGGKGRVDVDLSAIMYDSEWNYIEHISYTNLRGSHVIACHSGDITSAPNGASEFIDLDMNSVLKQGGRYILADIRSFTGQTFDNVPECFAGIMMREHPKSGEIYDPRTVLEKFDVTSKSRNCIPMIIDCQNREMIWADLALKNSPNYRNNLENNSASVAMMGKAVANINKANLFDLFSLHAKSRGTIVDNIEDADTVFSIDNAWDFEKIVSEYL